MEYLMEEKKFFSDALGNTPVIKVLEFLIGGKGLDYSLSDITRNSNIGWATLHRIWHYFENAELVKHTRNIGQAKLYTLNLENPVAKQLVKLYDVMLFQHTEKSLAEKVRV
jgi:hypothetical protein